MARGLVVAVASRENEAGRAEPRIRSGWNRGVVDRYGADLGQIASNSERSHGRPNRNARSRWPRAGQGKGKDVGTCHQDRGWICQRRTRHVHTAVSSAVAWWLVFTRYRSSSVPGTQPTPACRLVVPGACKRFSVYFSGFRLPWPNFESSFLSHPRRHAGGTESPAQAEAWPTRAVTGIRGLAPAYRGAVPK